VLPDGSAFGVNAGQATAVRVDLWLWAARFFKTRSLARQAIESGKLSIAGQPVGKPSRLVRSGDRLVIERAGERFEVDVLAVSDSRGPATLAQTLYRELDASQQARQQERERRRLENAGFSAPAERPDKHARREIRKLQQQDGLPPWWPR